MPFATTLHVWKGGVLSHIAASRDPKHDDGVTGTGLQPSIFGPWLANLSNPDVDLKSKIPNRGGPCQRKPTASTHEFGTSFGTIHLGLFSGPSCYVFNWDYRQLRKNAALSLHHPEAISMSCSEAPPLRRLSFRNHRPARAPSSETFIAC